MLKLRLFHFNKLNHKRPDFEIDGDSLSFDREQRLVLSDASQVPGVKWQISDFGLQISDRSKLSGLEL